MKFFKIKSYAKINISLNVIKKLSSNFHKIESLITFINLYDLIYIRQIKAKNHKIQFRGKYSHHIFKNNTVNHLLKIIDKNNYLKGKKFEIKIIKNIPQKSGMGGGSMNAASIFKFLLAKNFFNINKSRIKKIANLIGNDVKLGLETKNTILSSNGNLTKFKKKLRFHVLVVKPNFGCSTKFIYSKIKSFSKAKYNNPKISLLSRANIIKSNNDLEKVAFKKYPKLKNLKLYLLKIKNTIFVRMTGSGSSIVAYFLSKKAAVNAAIVFKRKFKNYWCIVSKTI